MFDPKFKNMFENGVFMVKEMTQPQTHLGEIDYYNELDLVLLFPTMITGENISCSEWLPQIIWIF